MVLCIFFLYFAWIFSYRFGFCYFWLPGDIVTAGYIGRYPTRVLHCWCDAVTNLLANGSTAFIWKLCCHWLKGLPQYCYISEAGHTNCSPSHRCSTGLWWLSVQYTTIIGVRSPRYILSCLVFRGVKCCATHGTISVKRSAWTDVSMVTNHSTWPQPD